MNASQLLQSNCIPGQAGYDAAQCLNPVGGFTLWQASLEVRFDVAGPFGTAVFCDAGDVSATPFPESGAFRFAAEEAAPWACDEPVELSDALVEVDRLLKQWREILRVIPSLECRPRLLDALEVDEICGALVKEKSIRKRGTTYEPMPGAPATGEKTQNYAGSRG